MISDEYIDLEEVRRLTTAIGTRGQLRDLLAKAQRSYEICLKVDEEFDVLGLAGKLNERQTWKIALKAGKREGQRAEHWMFGELQIFTCIIFIYCHSKNITLPKLTQDDFLYLRSIFTHKSLEFIKYEVSRIIYSKGPRREWQEKETSIVKRIVGEASKHIDWRMVSFELFKESKGKYTRCQKECREKWKNYLNPNIKKGQWTKEEDEKLHQLIEKYGTKWSIIARHFKEERTEHMVKNRYNSLNRPSKKKRKQSWKDNGSNKINEECLSQISAIMQQAEQGNQSEQKPQIMEQHDQIIDLQEDNIVVLPQPEDISKDIQDSFSYLQATNYFQKKIISNSHSLYDNFLKKTNDQDQEQDKEFKICLEPNSPWNAIKQPQNGFDSIFSLEPEAKRSAMDEIVSALGCTHYERIFNSWEEEEAVSHFEWIE